MTHPICIYLWMKVLKISKWIHSCVVKKWLQKKMHLSKNWKRFAKVCIKYKTCNLVNRGCPHENRMPLPLLRPLPSKLRLPHNHPSWWCLLWHMDHVKCTILLMFIKAWTVFLCFVHFRGIGCNHTSPTCRKYKLDYCGYLEVYA